MTCFEMVRAGDLEALKEYVADGGDIGGKDESGNTLITAAALTGNKAIVTFLREHGAKPDFFTELALGSVPRITACLAAGGCTANSVDSRGFHPLMLVARRGHADAARLLIERGAAVNARHAMSGNTALMEAALGGSDEIVRLLIDKGADRSIKNHSGKDAATLAADAGHASAAALIRDYRRR